MDRVNYCPFFITISENLRISKNVSADFILTAIIYNPASTHLKFNYSYRNVDLVHAAAFFVLVDTLNLLGPYVGIRVT
eukprot:SAG31_NODE_90_length_26410_cov_175.663981_2_plen_78_part_00